MKRLRRGELRDLTCPRYRVVYWESCQKHFPTPRTELCISACCYHSLLKINTNTAQTQWSSASVGTRRQDDFKVEVRIGEEQRAGMIVCCDSSHKLCSPFGMSLLSHTSLPNEWRKKWTLCTNSSLHVFECLRNSTYIVSLDVGWFVGGMLTEPWYFLEADTLSLTLKCFPELSS